MIKYTIEIKEYIKNNHKGKSTIELSEEVNKVFGISTTPDKIQNLKSNIRRREGFIFYPARNDGCIKKGHIPKNKGTKGIYNIGGNKTSFKKGNISANNVPIGTEKWKAYGGGKNRTMYLFIKVRDGQLNNNWEPKHRLIYEKHYGKVPKGHKVVFADGDRTNFDINNLIIVSNSEELIMNKNNLIFDNKELTKTGSIIAKVIDKTNKLKNDRL